MSGIVSYRSPKTADASIKVSVQIATMPHIYRQPRCAVNFAAETDAVTWLQAETTCNDGAPGPGRRQLCASVLFVKYDCSAASARAATSSSGRVTA